MTIQEALAHGRTHLQSTSSTPDLDARLLLQYILQVSHSYLLAHGDELVTAVQTHTYQQLLSRAGQKEPIPYIIGTAPFYGLHFQVDTAVLIPRPETEQLVEKAIAWSQFRPTSRIVDVGTGSGCIAVTLARQLPQVHIEAIDISTAALTIARKNASRHAPDRIKFYQGHLLSPIIGAVDLIIANLPYIADHEWTGLDDGVKLYEPTIALRGGAAGLTLIQELLQQAAAKLSPDGLILLEIGWKQGPDVYALAQTHFPAVRIDVLPDLAGHDRIIAINME